MERVKISHSRSARQAICAEPADIALAVERGFTRPPDLDGRFIFVSANGSAITLAGWVSTSAEKTQAADIARLTPGVGSVFNELTVLL